MKRATILFILLMPLATISLAQAQGSNMTLAAWTADGGGGASNGGRYTLQSTTGQHDAGELTNGRYTLYAGYWNGPVHYDLYLPVVSRP